MPKWTDLDTEEDIARRRDLEERAAVLRARMGRRWLLHPDNYTRKHPHHAILDKKADETAVLRPDGPRETAS